MTSLRSMSWNMALISTRRFGRWRNSLVQRSRRTAQSPRGSVHPLWLPCSPALRRRICLITSRNAVPDCMTLPLFPSCRDGESVSRQRSHTGLALTPKQIRQEVTAIARVSSSQRIVSITLRDLLTRIHNRPTGR